MRRRSGATAAALILFALCPPSRGLAQDRSLTARARLPEVLAEGRRWQSDAVLIGLSTVVARSDGTAPEWKYAFYSPKTQKRFVATASGSGVTGIQVRLGFGTEPLGDFLDSDRAMAEARRQGLKGNEPAMSVRLLGEGKTAGAYWIVTGGYQKGDVSVFLDAKTGRFSSRAVME